MSRRPGSTTGRREVLNGKLPPALGSPANLLVLRLGYNDLGGEIPPCRGIWRTCESCFWAITNWAGRCRGSWASS